MNSTISRFAVFGLLDSQISATIRSCQEDLSLKTRNTQSLRFPVHITIRGRFLTEKERALCCFQEILDSKNPSGPIPLWFNGPIFQPPDLLWLKVNTTHESGSYLTSLHQQTDQICRKYLEADEYPQEFAGDHYRPHVTLGWGVVPNEGSAHIDEELLLEGSIEQLALVTYPPDWRENGFIEVVESKAL